MQATAEEAAEATIGGINKRNGVTWPCLASQSTSQWRHVLQGTAWSRIMAWILRCIKLSRSCIILPARWLARASTPLPPVLRQLAGEACFFIRAQAAFELP